jgi:hypothetical protein
MKALFSAILGGNRRSKRIMEESYELRVHLACDQDSGRWYVAESDIPGLWLEADNPIALIERIQLAAPEMIELNQSEIVEKCRAKNAKSNQVAQSGRATPLWKPVFDSPLSLASV